jgi:hypothetical protein
MRQFELKQTIAAFDSKLATIQSSYPPPSADRNLR